MQFFVSASTIVYSTGLYNIPKVRQRWLEDILLVYALHLASSIGLVIAVGRLLDAGYNINKRNKSGGTPLYFAYFKGH